MISPDPDSMKDGKRIQSVSRKHLSHPVWFCHEIIILSIAISRRCHKPSSNLRLCSGGGGYICRLYLQLTSQRYLEAQFPPLRPYLLAAWSADLSCQHLHNLLRDNHKTKTTRKQLPHIIHVMIRNYSILLM